VFHALLKTVEGPEKSSIQIVLWVAEISFVDSEGVCVLVCGPLQHRVWEKVCRYREEENCLDLQPETELRLLTLWRRIFFLNFSTLCM
jgi:hypothetical protein